jgi:hypothetical protein
MLHTSMEMPRKCPLGVSILAILEGLQGIGFLIIGLMALVEVVVAASSSGSAIVDGSIINGADMGFVSGILVGIFPVVGFMSLPFAWGLWQLSRWAFWATVIIQVIILANSVIAFIQVIPTLDSL